MSRKIADMSIEIADRLSELQGVISPHHALGVGQ